MTRAPGSVRDCIVSYLANAGSASLAEIQAAVNMHLGSVAPSSVRSYLNLNTPALFARIDRGSYRLKNGRVNVHAAKPNGGTKIGSARIVQADCFEWLASVREGARLHAIVTDPPYGGIEYTHKEQTKLRNGNKGGVWRIPPSFDGHKRSPLPRFTVLGEDDREALRFFFQDFGKLALRATVPGANIIVASNPLLVHLVADAMASSGLEPRGYITRLVMTMRGGDRPKNAEKDFPEVSVLPRSMFEPWVVMRHPLDGRVQDNLRKWKTGGFRRISDDRPFGDVIKSSPTPKAEKDIAPHPSLKPQAFLRAVVRAALPMGEGIVCDPFAGSGSTLAAANAIGYESIGIESDDEFLKIARQAIPKLSRLLVNPILS
ncbi:MAG TPA: DNA methyltransferase [Xanthobacteraceae bacterium]|nr:DNA methyltransferase [Xanthobacteraceae bacterium]